MQHNTHPQQGTVSVQHEMSGAIQAALDCHAVCVQTLQHCARKGGHHAEAEHLGILQDCAQICVVSADFMLRDSPVHAQVCGACADTCEACAASCEAMSDDAQMQACIDACRRCAQECRRMARTA
jgi:hypothetical protein